MSGRKQPAVPAEVIDYIFRRLEIKKLRNHIDRQERENRKLSGRLEQAQKSIRAAESGIREQKQAIDRISGRIGTLEQKERDSREFAEHSLNLVKELYQALEKMEMERFFPREFGTYTDQIRNMEANLQNGQYQACTALAQNWHTLLARDVPGIEQTCIEGQALEIELNDSFDQVAKMMNITLVKREFSTKQGANQVVDIEIPLWAEKEWLAAKQEFENARKLKTGLGRMNLDQMKELERLLDTVVDRVNHAGFSAEGAFIRYIRKMDLQSDIAEKMVRRGFEVVDNLFQEDDPRLNNILLMENERGEKILVNIGEEADELSMEVDFNTLDPLTHAQRLEGIMAAVGAKDYATVRGYENRPAEEHFFDLARYRERKV